MGVYGAFEYGTGIVYGGLVSLVVPPSGPITGGTTVTITGQSFQATALDDSFGDGVLDPVKWTAAIAGSASSVAETTEGLRLRVAPTAGSSAQVTGNTTVTDTDLEVSWDIVTQIAALPAPGDVELATLKLYIDANNYVYISRKAGPLGHRYEAKVVVGGGTVDTALLVTTSADDSGSLRLIRRGTTVYMYSGTTEVLRSRQFVSTAAAPVLSADNLAAAYAIETLLSDFYVHTMVVFGTEPMLDAVVVEDNRISGTTPEGIAVAAVDVYMATYVTTLQTISNGYTYTDPTLFNIFSAAVPSQTVNVSISNDPILRNIRTGRPGFLR